MLSTADNELLTRVGPGTPMGELMRRYWIPAVLSHEVVADGVPHRTRLLGEDLLVVRVTSGRVGTMHPLCPHRGAGLFFARNEEEGIRCAYHGWKFDVDGACLDMPSEPPESNFHTKVKLKTYRTEERRGLIWIYLGPDQDAPPPLPALEWNMVPEEHCYITKRVVQNNYVQAMEGEIDSSHSSFLHSSFQDPHRLATKQEQGMVYKMRDRHPRFEVVDTDYGVLIGARRNAEADSYYWRVTQFLLPFHTIIPPYGADPNFSGHAWIPMDDTHLIAMCFTYNPVRPLTEQEIEFLKHNRDGQQGLHPTINGFLAHIANRPEGDWWPKNHIDVDFNMDWDLQRATQYSGLPGIWVQDSGMQETMGSIVDRTSEHLGISDSAVIRTRRSLIRAARTLDEHGIEPATVRDASLFNIRSAAVVLPRVEGWVEGTEKFRECPAGVNFAAV